MRRLSLCHIAVLTFLLLAVYPARAQDTTTADTTITDTTATDTTAADAPAMDAPAPDADAAASAETVVAVIQQSPDHSTLARAIEAADLVEALEETGPFTVFAPTDSAFDALPPGRLDSLLLEENQSQLRALLRHHAVVAEWAASDLEARVQNDRARVETVRGDSLTLSMQGGNLMVDDGAVVQTDLRASNGLVHVVDAVLIPTEQPGATETTTESRPMQEGAMEDGVVEDDNGMEGEAMQRDTAAANAPPMENPPVQDDAMEENPMDDDAMQDGTEVEATDNSAAMVPRDTTIMVPRDTTIMVPRDTTIMVPRDTTIMVPAPSPEGAARPDTTRR